MILGPLEFRITTKTHLYKNQVMLIYFIKLDLNGINNTKHSLILIILKCLRQLH